MAMVEVDGTRGLRRRRCRPAAAPSPRVCRGWRVELAAAARRPLRRLHRRRMGCAGRRPIGGSARTLRDGGLRRLPGPLRRCASALDEPHVVGLSFGGALAIEFCRRHPAVRVHADARRRLRRMGGLASARDRAAAPPPGAGAVRAVSPGRVRRRVAADDVRRTGDAGSCRRRAARGDAHAFHPAGFRAMARASCRGLAVGAAAYRGPDALDLRC